MGVFDIVMEKPAEISRFSMTMSNTPIASTDFSRFFHDYIKHIPLQLTSAGFSMTISNTLTASTDFSRFSRSDGCV
jgi:hypothetical protein